jgi:putative transposase
VSRQLRLEFPGAIWHVTSRGNERRVIYRDDADRRRFLKLLASAVRDRRWILHAWVLMSNHYHLLIETPEVGLSRGMKWLNQMYAEGFNRRHARVGHLFQGRFKSILVERESHLLELVRYIVLNPVRAGMVEAAEHYRWSNYRATAGLEPAPPWLDVLWTLARFGTSSVAQARHAYRDYVNAADASSYRPWQSLIGQIYLGDEAFREALQDRVRERPRSCEHPLPQREIAVHPAAIVAAVCRHFECSDDALRSRRTRDARTAFAATCFEAGVTLRAAGDLMDVTGAAASLMRLRSEQRYVADAEYRRRIEAVRAELKLNL